MRYSQLCDVTFGSGVIKEVGVIATNLGIKKALIVTDKIVDSIGIPDKVISFLRKSGVECTKYNKVEMDAPDYCVNEGSNVAINFNVDGVVAIGGGSCLDCAKAIALIAANDGKVKIQDFFDATPNSLDLKLPLKNIMIPTTSGTGSEVTIVAVITDTAKHRKCGCFVRPNAAIVDPELTLGLNAEITAFTAMDAFSHCVEALSSKGFNPHSDLLALSSIERIIRWAPISIKDSYNIEAREQLAIASNFAGKAFNDSMVHVGHALAHSLGACYHMPHGIACALVTPVVLEYTAKSRPEIFKKVARLFDLNDVCDENLGLKLAESVRSFNRLLGIPSMKTQGISREQAGACSEYTKTEAMRFASIISIPDDEFKNMLTRSWDTYR